MIQGLQYDYVFVTHLPAFYKINLYNQIAEHCKVYVIFIASGSTIRTQDFTAKKCNFEYCIINQGPFELRPKLYSALNTLKVVKRLNYRYLVVGGWDLVEFWALILFSKKSKKALALESSIFESNLKGYRKLVKTWFLKQVDLVFSSGTAHQDLLKQLNYMGNCRKTMGVGIINYAEHTPIKRHFKGRFLYVGRFSPEKNILLLIKAFQSLPQYQLTMVGGGPQKMILEQNKPKNVTLLDHVPNTELEKIYCEHDVFILPSTKEPWGLVVEEALHYGLPVIASDKVGAGPDLVQNQFGKIFEHDNVDALCAAIRRIESEYPQIANNVAKIDLKAKDLYQVNQYLEALL